MVNCSMDKRRFERKLTHLKAEFITSGISYTGFIENISEDGLFMTTDPSKTGIDFTPAIPRELKFQLPSGDILLVQCDVRWFYMKTASRGLRFTMGIKITNPPQKYNDFIKTVQ
jgi:hypothetical protein